ncbi:MAG: hypothetical protein J0L86_01510 [Flavobacteriales bacterium]|nr:hypothetical protein [Flavobacteriales bacterium]
MENYTSNKKYDSTAAFFIQPGFVEGVIAEELEFNSIETAFENIFKNNKEFCVISWNKIPFKLSYKEDIPFLIPSITKTLDLLFNSDEKNWSTHFYSKNCDFTWSFSIIDDSIFVVGDFIKISGNHQKAINSLSNFRMDINTFLKEWKLLIEQILSAFEQSEHQLTNSNDQKLIDILFDINAFIPSRALRYQYDKR